MLSDPKPINISVLQGSILGPILFLIMINDLPDSADFLTFLFADDTQGIINGKNLPELIDRANEGLRKWAEWFRANKLKVNTEKTKFIIFHPKGKSADMQDKQIIFNDNEPGEDNPSLIYPLERIANSNVNSDNKAYKLLGVYLDENLSFNTHIAILCKKLSRSIFCINKVKNILTKPALKTLYYSLVHSHLTYCTSIYSCTTKTNLDKVFKLQKKAIRIITKSNYNAPTQTLFENLNILPLDKIITYSNLTIMHSIHNKYSPPSMFNLWPKNSDRNTAFELRNANNYATPQVKYSFFTRFPAYTMPLLWNNYKGTAKLHDNPTTFKICLKNELLGTLPISLPIPLPLPPPPPPPSPPPKVMPRPGPSGQPGR